MVVRGKGNEIDSSEWQQFFKKNNVTQAKRRDLF